MFLQNSQENTRARVSFLIKLQAWGVLRNFKNTFLCRTPPVAASIDSRNSSELTGCTNFTFHMSVSSISRIVFFYQLVFIQIVKFNFMHDQFPLNQD